MLWRNLTVLQLLSLLSQSLLVISDIPGTKFDSSAGVASTPTCSLRHYDIPGTKFDSCLPSVTAVSKPTCNSRVSDIPDMKFDRC